MYCTWFPDHIFKHVHYTFLNLRIHMYRIHSENDQEWLCFECCVLRAEKRARSFLLQSQNRLNDSTTNFKIADCLGNKCFTIFQPYWNSYLVLRIPRKREPFLPAGGGFSEANSPAINEYSASLCVWPLTCIWSRSSGTLNVLQGKGELSWNSIALLHQSVLGEIRGWKRCGWKRKMGGNG